MTESTGFDYEELELSKQTFELVSCGFGETVSKVRRDLQHLRTLQSDAVAKLGAHFSDLNHMVQEQRRLLLLLVQDMDLDGEPGEMTERQEMTETLDHIGELSRRIDGCAKAAVLSLQFEDIAGQLTHHVDRRCMLLEMLIDGIETARKGEDPAAYVVGLNALREMATENQEALDEVFSSVHHANLEQGEVELF